MVVWRRVSSALQRTLHALHKALLPLYLKLRLLADVIAPLAGDPASGPPGAEGLEVSVRVEQLHLLLHHKEVFFAEATCTPLVCAYTQRGADGADYTLEVE